MIYIYIYICKLYIHLSRWPVFVNARMRVCVCLYLYVKSSLYRIDPGPNLKAPFELRHGCVIAFPPKQLEPKSSLISVNKKGPQHMGKWKGDCHNDPQIAIAIEYLSILHPSHFLVESTLERCVVYSLARIWLVYAQFFQWGFNCVATNLTRGLVGWHGLTEIKVWITP